LCDEERIREGCGGEWMREGFVWCREDERKICVVERGWAEERLNICPPPPTLCASTSIHLLFFSCSSHSHVHALDRTILA
jgi:hypothetical protein